jgi:hypothetical protein
MKIVYAQLSAGASGHPGVKRQQGRILQDTEGAAREAALLEDGYEATRRMITGNSTAGGNTYSGTY